jgi:predicted TIM-barrel enzyme
LSDNLLVRKNRVLIVIHAQDPAQALRNAAIAFEAGADGIFLINHRIDYTALLECYRAVRERHPKRWIGINPLGREPRRAIVTTPPLLNGLWVDDIGVNEDAQRPEAEAKDLWELRRHLPYLTGRFFGSIAFKHQKEIRDPARIAQLVAPFVDVITTSGERTGVPPTIEKIRAIREAIGPRPFLAIASGITPENIADYLPLADHFLANTGVSRLFTELDPARIRALVAAANPH